MEKMNPEVKAAWVAALRSGEYKQGSGQLRKGDEFCCLGVLCDLHSRTTPSSLWHASGDYICASGVPPSAVLGWAGLVDPNPTITAHNKTAAIAIHNDGSHLTEACTFAEIADAIEAQL